jgi:hypothetical protein
LTSTTVVEPRDSSEGQLDQLLVGGVIVEGPGHDQPPRAVDQRVLAPRAGLRAVWLAHHDPDRSAHSQIDLGKRRVPIGPDVKPPSHHLGAGPCVKDLLGAGRKGPLDTHDVAGFVDHDRSSCSSR